ncbi:alpha/beta fold hydrolase [Candidatus Saccharibacteria bacterium]|nr:alpha/beta fold hydrolase [Candidatus Saccharibacteria bacterium]
MGVFDTVIHRWLRIPYALHVRKKRLRKRTSVTYIFIHGLGDTGELWEPLLKKLPENVNYVTVDLLGFGDSKKPEWARYNATMQARSLLMTFTRLGIVGDVVVIGHSLGGLVAVESAKRYPLYVKKLVLCSPPIYDSDFSPSTKKLHQDTLNHLYRDVSKSPNLVINAYALGKRLRIVNQSLKVTPETLPAFMSSLQASIVNQNTLKLIGQLKMPIVIIDGLFDVLTVNQVLKEIAKNNDNIQLITINTSHIINKTYAKKILEVLGYSPRGDKKIKQGSL